VLADLTKRLAMRRLPKTLPLPAEATPAQLDQVLERARNVAAAHGFSAELAVRLDAPSEAPYSEPDDDSAAGLWVVIRHQPIARLGRTSFLLGELRNKAMQRPRLIFPAEIRDEMTRALEGLLGTVHLAIADVPVDDA
jgi:uncharacterized protein